MRTIGIGASSGNGGPFDLEPSATYAAIDNPTRCTSVRSRRVPRP
jgi:hypothetical protein